MKVTLDTNILVYATDASSEHHAAAAKLIERAANADCIQTLQSVCECFHVLRRKRHLGLDVALAAVANLRRLFPIVEHRLDDLERAIAAVAAHQIAFWDAMLWATAKRAGCRMILSEDFQDGRNLEGVLFVNPFKPENARLLDWATAKRAGCRMILSQDFQDGRNLEGVLFVNPSKPENARLLDAALPPTKGTAP